MREMVLGLKLGAVARAPFRRRHGVDPAARFAGALAPLTEAGWLVVGPEAVELSRQGLLRVDRLLPGLYRREHRVGRTS